MLAKGGRSLHWVACILEELASVVSGYYWACYGDGIAHRGGGEKCQRHLVDLAAVDASRRMSVRRLTILMKRSMTLMMKTMKGADVGTGFFAVGAGAGGDGEGCKGQHSSVAEGDLRRKSTLWFG